MKRKLLVASGVATSLIFLGSAGVSFAQTTAVSSSGTLPSISMPTRAHMKGFRIKNSEKLAQDLSVKFGLDATKVKNELDSGKTLKDIFTENNITKDEVKTLFSEQHKFLKGAAPFTKGGHGPMLLKSEPILQANAAVLGMSVDDLRAKIADGKLPPQIAVDQGMTIEVFRQKMQVEIEKLIADGTISGKEATFFQKMAKRGDAVK